MRHFLPPSSHLTRTQAQTHHHHHRSISQTRPITQATSSPDLFCRSPLPSPMEQPTTSTPGILRARRSSRPAGPLIDLTDAGAADQSSTPVPKRRRTTSRSPTAHFSKVAKVDLSNEEDDATMGRNREELLRAQDGSGGGGKRKKLAGFTCVICMEDEPTDLAATPCGHMFCHLCLHGAIKASTTTTNKLHGRCPVCRGKVSLKDVVVMEFKLLSKAQGKQRAK